MARVLNLYTAQHAEGFEKDAAYNALDTIATLMVDNTLDARMSDRDKRTFNFYMACQVPAFDMTTRGILVDETAKEELKRNLYKEVKQTERKLQSHPLIKPIWDKLIINSGRCEQSTRKDGKHKWPRGVEDTPDKLCETCGCSRFRIRPFMPSSGDDVKHLFYDLWGFDAIYGKSKEITTDKEARDQLKNLCKRTKKNRPYLEPLELLDEYADLAKQHQFLGFKSDDGRFHSAFNVAVASTHRWTSNKDHFGRGKNAQNITEKQRYIFTADPGYTLFYADLKQAESNVIAHKSGDENYIEAHRVGDTHTFVCRLVWPEGINGQQWTNDISEDKKIATSAAPPWDNRPGHDYRFQSKAVQHGSNLGLTSFGLAVQKHIPLSAATESQKRYFRAFPYIRTYQQWIRNKVEAQEEIITPLGVRFKLFGRPWDEHTYKEALAIIPQSMVGHIISMGCWLIYQHIPEIQLLAQVHDAILGQYPNGREDLLYKALELMTIPVPVEGVDGKTRVITIGTEAAVGHNWGHYNDNPDKGPLNLDGIREIHFNSPTDWTIK